MMIKVKIILFLCLFFNALLSYTHANEFSIQDGTIKCNNSQLSVSEEYQGRDIFLGVAILGVPEFCSFQAGVQLSRSWSLSGKVGVYYSLEVMAPMYFFGGLRVMRTFNKDFYFLNNVSFEVGKTGGGFFEGKDGLHTEMTIGYETIQKKTIGFTWDAGLAVFVPEIGGSYKVMVEPVLKWGLVINF